jgi:WD40 repeat protein
MDASLKADPEIPLDPPVSLCFYAVTGQPHGSPLQLERIISAVVFSPDSKKLAIHSVEGRARIWDTSTGQPMSPILRHESRTPPASRDAHIYHCTGILLISHGQPSISEVSP